MACPTCDHTMQRISRTGATAVYHCGRCGSVLTHYMSGYETLHVPALVKRCRDFVDYAEGHDLQMYASRFSVFMDIVESCLKPEHRPKELPHGSANDPASESTEANAG